jgi:hypothetical protein
MIHMVVIMEEKKKYWYAMRLYTPFIESYLLSFALVQVKVFQQDL